MLMQVKLGGGGGGRARAFSCELDGRGSGKHAVWGAGAGAILEGLVTVRAHCFARLTAGSLGMQFAVLGAVLQG